MAGKSKSESSDASMPLGQVSAYVDEYTPELLFPLPRAQARSELLENHPAAELPFVGEDIWTAYELTWLDTQGRPQAAIAQLSVPCESPAMVESKSMKLCLNSLAQTRFATHELLRQQLVDDLSQAFGAPVQVTLSALDDWSGAPLPGRCVDNAEVEINQYSRNPKLLQCHPNTTEQQLALYSHQFRSLCPVTGQPDFASIWLEYSGPSIDEGSLFAYLVSYRTHSGFHENAIEQIFMDLQQCCGCTALTVYGRFLRRGGIDINPFRSTQQQQAPAWRLARQ